MTHTIPSFLNFAATKKKVGKDWAFLYIKSSSDEVNVEEIAQFLEFHLQKDGPVILDFNSKNEIFLVVRDTNRKLTYFDKKIYETFPSDKVVAVTNTLDAKGLDQLTQLISPHIEPDDVPGKISLKRLSRASNSIMVFDDDVMVIRQMEHILTGFGHVTAVQDHNKFIESYKQYAPNILFLDIHLRDGVEGTSFMENLLSEIDPSAYVIIISSDTAVETIKKIKTKGVKGFVMKPFDRNKLFQCVMRAPTFVPRTAKS